MDIISVDKKALLKVLAALTGPPHLIRELQATRDRPPIIEGNPIDILLKCVSEMPKIDNMDICTKEPPGCILIGFGECSNGCGYYRAPKPSKEYKGTKSQHHYS